MEKTCYNLFKIPKSNNSLSNNTTVIGVFDSSGSMSSWY